MPVYIVKPGDWLSKIAKAHRLSGWRAIYDHPKNADFRKKRPDPNLISPGDEVFIPERNPGSEDGQTETENRFRCKGDKPVLRIAVEGADGRRLSAAKYELTVGEDVHTGTTDGEGLLEVKIGPGAGAATLRVGDDVWDLLIGHLNPIDADTPDAGISGAQGRLLNLGYPVGAIDGVLGPKTRSGIRYFQADQRMEETGRLDDKTRMKIVEVHGC